MSVRNLFDPERHRKRCRIKQRVGNIKILAILRSQLNGLRTIHSIDIRRRVHGYGIRSIKCVVIFGIAVKHIVSIESIGHIAELPSPPPLPPEEPLPAFSTITIIDCEPPAAFMVINVDSEARIFEWSMQTLILADCPIATEPDCGITEIQPTLISPIVHEIAPEVPIFEMLKVNSE